MYISIDVINNSFFHSYYDKGMKYEIIKKFPLELFQEAENGKYRDLFNKKLNRVEFDNCFDFYSFFKNNDDVYGQENPIYQFLAKKYPDDIEPEIDNINIYAIDIETYFDDSGFGLPENPTKDILSISCVKLNNNVEQKPIVFGRKKYNGDDCIYVFCSDEKDLLIKFQKFIKLKQIGIITGWNVKNYDMPYIINRWQKLFGMDGINNFSPFSDLEKNAKLVFEISSYSKHNYETTNNYKIVGITILDYFDLYQKYSTTPVDDYRLNTIAEYELQKNKTDYSEYKDLMTLYEKNFDRFIEYNINDVVLIKQLNEKLNYISHACMTAYLGKTRFEDIFFQVRWWDIYIYNELKKLNIQIPYKKESNEVNIIGGYVKNPESKLYSWIMTYDLTSLYPSIIMSFNLSPETIISSATYRSENIIENVENDNESVSMPLLKEDNTPLRIAFDKTIPDSIPDRNGVEKLLDGMSKIGVGHVSCLDDILQKNVDTSFLKKKNCTMLANGAQFLRNKEGIFTSLVKKLFTLRMNYRNKAKEYAQLLEKEKSDVYVKLQASADARQLAIKIQLNSLYGACANRYFRYNNQDISEGITITGQYIIRTIADKINEYLNDLLKNILKEKMDFIVFSDTDSIGINLQIIVERLFSASKNKQDIITFLDNFSKEYILPKLKLIFKEIEDYLNLYENHLDMKREIIADAGIWSGKKHYILQVYDKEGLRFQTPKLKIMGLEMIKSSTPKLVRIALTDAIKICLNGTEEELQKFVADFKLKFFNANYIDLALPRSVNDIDKWLEQNNNIIHRSYKSILKKGVPYHVRGSVNFNDLLKKFNVNNYKKIKNGDKIKILFLRKDNPSKENVICFTDDIPEIFNLSSYIDYETQYQKAFIQPLDTLLKILSWEYQKSNNLSVFF